MNSPHLSFEEILDATEGRATSDRVSAHLATCGECRRVAAGVTHVLATMEYARGLETVPADLRGRALARVARELAEARTTAPATSFLRGLVDRLRETAELTIGALVADSLQASAATRGGAEITAAPRMLLYETAGYDITLSLAPGDAPGALEVTGQVTPRSGDLPEGGVAGVRVGEHTATSALTRYGEFAFDAVPRGDLEVEIALGGSIIRLTPIPRHEVE